MPPTATIETGERWYSGARLWSGPGTRFPGKDVEIDAVGLAGNLHDEALLNA